MAKDDGFHSLNYVNLFSLSRRLTLSQFANKMQKPKEFALVKNHFLPLPPFCAIFAVLKCLRKSAIFISLDFLGF